MAEFETHLGKITLTDKYLKKLVGHTAGSCFGVADMCPCAFRQDFSRRIKHKPAPEDGVSIDFRDGKLEIGLHICVVLGTNISAASDSLAHKIKYTVEENTGLTVSKVSVFVEDVRS